MSFWGQVAVNVVSIFVAGLGIAFGALLIWAGRSLWLYQPGPDFIYRRKGAAWELERVKRSTATDIVAGNGQMDMSDDRNWRSSFIEESQRDLRTLSRGSRVGFIWSEDRSAPAPALVWFAWTQGRRRYSRSIPIKADVDEYPVFAVERKRSDHRMLT